MVLLFFQLFLKLLKIRKYSVKGVKDKSSFTRQEILDSFRNNGFNLGNASFF